MTISVEPPRYEIKIPCESSARAEIEAWVRLHPAHWRVAYPPRQVNSLYFDTGDYASLNENLSGSGERAKLRLRWYGPTLILNGPTRLELKRKEGLVGWKEIAWPDLQLDLTQQSWSDLLSILRRAVTGRALAWLDQFAYPTLINYYRRAYYATLDGALRLTLDSDLHAYDQRFSARPNLDRAGLLTHHALLELKAPTDPTIYRRLAEVLAHFPVRVDRYSKYVQGMLSAPDFEGVELP